MARLLISDPAAARVREVPRDRPLLTAVGGRREAAAADPGRWTEHPPPIPHRQDARLMAFFAHDSAGQRWGFSVLFLDVADGLKVIAFEFNDATDYPDTDD